MTRPSTPGSPDSPRRFGGPTSTLSVLSSRRDVGTHVDEFDEFEPTRIVACLHFMIYTFMLDDANVLFRFNLSDNTTTVVACDVQSFGIRNIQHQLMIVQNNKLQTRPVRTSTKAFTPLHDIVCSSVNTAICDEVVFAHNQKIYQYQPNGHDTLILDANMPVDYFQMDSNVLLAKTQDCRFKVFVKTTGQTGQTGQFEPKYTINKINVRASILQDSFTILMWRTNKFGRIITNSVDAQRTTNLQPPWASKVAFYSQTNTVLLENNGRIDVMPNRMGGSDAPGAPGASDASDASGGSGASDASDGHVSGTSSLQNTSVSSHESDQTTPSTASGGSARAAQPAKRKVSCELPTTLPKLPRLARSETVLCIDVLQNQLLVLTTKKASIYTLDTLANGELTQSKAKIIHVAAKLAKLLPDNQMLCLSDKLVLYTHHKHHKPEQLAKFAKTTIPAGLATHNHDDREYAIVALNPAGEIWQVDMHSKQMNSFTRMRRNVVSLASLPDWLCVALHDGITVISWQDRYVVHTLRTNLANLAPSKLCSCDDKLFAVSTTIQVWTNQRILQTTRNQHNVIVDSEQQCEARRDAIIACAADDNHLFVAHLLQTPLVDKYTYKQLGMDEAW